MGDGSDVLCLLLVGGGGLGWCWLVSDCLEGGRLASAHCCYCCCWWWCVMRGVPATPLHHASRPGPWQRRAVGWMDWMHPHRQACPSAMSAPSQSQSTWWRPTTPLLFFVRFAQHSLTQLILISLFVSHTLNTHTHTHYLQFLRTTSCVDKCAIKFNSEADKAIHKVVKEAIKKCEKKCDDNDKKCEKKCDNGKNIKISSVEKKM